MSKKNIYHSIGELFCGPGGGGLGASLAKIEVDGATHCFEHRWASDLDLDTCKTYSKSVLLSNDELSEKVICARLTLAVISRLFFFASLIKSTPLEVVT